MKGTILDFLQLLVDKPELAKELEELAARFDFEFTEEVSDDDLDAVSGGALSAPQDLSADVPLTEGQIAAPFIPGGAVVTAAISGIRQLKDGTGLGGSSGA
jgi:hypothetical protein